MRRLLGLSVLFALFAAGPALAKDKKDKDKKEEDEEFVDEKLPDASEFRDAGEEEEEPAPAKPAEPEPEEKDEPEPDDLDFQDSEDEDVDFSSEEEQQSVKPRGPGEDSAQIYRDYQKKVAEYTPDEELIAWENYLKKYPKSLFADRIEKRTEELSAELFSERVPGSDRGARREDAANRELNFASPLQFESAEPRTRLGVSAEIGIPNWFAPDLDAELEILRPLSVHLGLDREVNGMEVALGGKYAIIKSARTHTVLSGALDLRLNASPTVVGLRPAILAGQAFPNVMQGLYLQAAVGITGELRDPPGLRYFYGFDAELRPADLVYVFVETTGELKYLGSDQFDSFQFMVASFGLKFVPTKGGFPSVLANKEGFLITHDKKPLVISLGANIPYSYRYWGFYRGSVTIGAEFYL